MWQVLSFFGKFHPDYLSTLPETDAQQPGSTTAEQKKKTRAAAEARSRYCEGARVYRIQQKLQEKDNYAGPLTKHQKEVLDKWESGELLRTANRITCESGHGRLKKKDGKSLDIGGSTSGYCRRMLQIWSPPDATAFVEELLQ